MSRRVGLIILDGWGIAKDPQRSALDMASTPCIDSLSKYPNSTLVTFGDQVGLPAGQMGNSEVGHLNIGAGRIVYQDLAKINKAISEGTLSQNAVLCDLISKAEDGGRKVHLMGLVSDGGVHAHIDHVKALVDILEESDIEKICIHAFMDGRDTSPTSGKDYIIELLDHISDKKAELASIVGRYYAMDRDNRWERIKVAYDVLVNQVGEAFENPVQFIQSAYDQDVTDEFLPAGYQAGMDTRIEEGDIVLFFNYRTDRPRQLTMALTQNAFPDYEMQPIQDLHFVTMTQYNESFEGLHVMFQKDNLQNTLGEVIANAGRTQIRLAETEKYPHVTFFFSGGQEEPFEGERRLLVKSPDVATYDLQPEMSAEAVTDALLNALEEADRPDFFCLNYANTDMVGHTGNIEAAVLAAEMVDACLGRLIPAAMEKDYALLIIADHGNSDIIVNEDGTPHTAHTTNLVPIWYVDTATKNATLSSGKLGDIAPTVLHLLGIEIPKEMTGKILV